MVDAVRGAIERLNPGAPVRFERFAAASTPAARTAAVRTAAANTRRAAARRGAGADLGDHGRAPPQLSDGARGCLGARGGRTRRPRAAVLVPRRNLRDLPDQDESGRAVMAHNIALEPWEVDAGFILCCQARPLTASLELTYDEK